MRHVLAIAMVLVLAAAASADKVTFKDGGGLEGTLVKETETHMTFEVLIGGKPVKITVDRKRIATYEKTKTTADEYNERVRKTKLDDAKGLFALARWCLERKMKDQATEHLRQVVLADPKHAEAGKQLKELGFLKVGELWMSEAEYRDYLDGGGKADAGADAAMAAAEEKRKRREAEKQQSLMEGLRSHLARAERKLEETEKSLSACRNEVAKSEVLLETATKEFLEVKRHLGGTSSQRASGERRDYLFRMERKAAQLDAEIRKLKYTLRTHNTTIARFESLQKSQKAEVDRLQKRLREQEQEAKEKQEEQPVQKPVAPPPVSPPPPSAPPPAVPQPVAPPPAPVAPAPVAPAPVPSAPAPVPSQQ